MSKEKPTFSSGLIVEGSHIGTAKLDGINLAVIDGNDLNATAGAKVLGGSKIDKLDHTDRNLATNISSFNFDQFINHPTGQAQANGPDFKLNGRVAIFNQGFDRAGSEVDVANLKETFQKRGVLPTILHNSTFDEIATEIKKLSTDDLSHYKLFVCIVMAHGNTDGRIYDADYREFKVEPTIIDPILENTTLNNIPKIFIIVACRGDTEYRKYDDAVKCSDENDMEIDGLGYDGHFSGPAGKAPYLISYSTMEGLASYRSTILGTFYMNSFCKHMNEANGETDIISIFTRVNDDLSNKFQIQVPVYETSMGDIRFKHLA